MGMAADHGAGSHKNGRSKICVAGTVGCGVGVVGEACLPGGEATDLPAANDLIGPSGHCARKRAPVAERKLINEVAVEDLGKIEVGVGAALAGTRRIADELALIV